MAAKSMGRNFHRRSWFECSAWFVSGHDFSRSEKTEREWDFRPVTFKDGRSVVSRVAVDRVPVCFYSPARGGRCGSGQIKKAGWVSAGGLRLLEGVAVCLIVDGIRYPVVTLWVSMEHWLRGSQVSKARPGAPIAFFRHGAFRRSPPKTRAFSDLNISRLSNVEALPQTHVQKTRVPRLL
jgi:hypothetical protein